MRRISLLVAVVVAASLVVGVSLASGLAKPEILRFVDVEETFHPLDGWTGEEAPAVGARFVFTEGLYEWAGTKRGKRAGRFDGMCTFTKVNVATETGAAYCVATAYLARGHVLVAGFIPLNDQFVVSVIGGTGRYANARGTVTFKNLPSGNQSTVFRLVP